MFFVLLLCSCSSQVKYYEYCVKLEVTDYPSNGYYYCTIEVTEDKIIYRASATLFGNEMKLPIHYMQLEMDNKKESKVIELKDFTRLVLYANISSESIYTSEKYIKWDFIRVFNFEEKLLSLSFTKHDQQLFPVYNRVRNHYCTSNLQTMEKVNDFDNMLLDRVGIWFPRKLKRTKKIDYSRFLIAKDLIDNIDDSVENEKVLDILKVRMY